MSSVELYTERTRIWLPDKELIWRGATLAKSYKDGDAEIKVYMEDNEGEVEAEMKSIKLVKGKLPHLRNPDILVGENDLTSLSYLHEPAVLHNLQVRFVEKNAVYTYCGIVLVAINPYENMDIYSDDFIQLYSGSNVSELDPHIFAIAEEAFVQMSRDSKNQSIIVTGESGAGKTVSAKFTMRYFASAGGTNTKENNVEQKVLASNPIMEAIGNAKTIRNDNSSRFGKYIEISFNKTNQIIGANMRTYLLEKSRVVAQTANERNYHIFYQLCSCHDMPQFQPLKLMPASEFEYTNMGECMTIDNVDDKKNFFETAHALTLLGVSSQYQSLMFRVLSSILHMGNIKIMKKGDYSTVDPSDEHLATMCELLGIEATQMLQWLTNKKLTTMTEVVVKPMNQDQAIQARNALAKHMYSKLFEWIVAKVNEALSTSAKQDSFIGVLDIYGFETFKVNSFEQFCINYANEKLQQQFCNHVFKLEQDEYVREGIEWKFITFTDNQPCIALIEDKMGILDQLNDQCKLQRGSDEAWAQKLFDLHLGKSKHFEKSKLSNTSFFVVHFADKVRYEIEGFLEKNRDAVSEEQLAILKASQYSLVSELFIEPTDSQQAEVTAGVGKKGRITVSSSTTRGNRRVGGNKNKKTVASQFQQSLALLMKTLNSTTPHYVRCIKPNDYKLAFTYDVTRASQQLRACGVLETIRISAAGYPSRWSYNEFVGRYRVLMKSSEARMRKQQDTCTSVLKRLIGDDTKYQCGKTKIFFRAGQVAYMEKLRAEKLRGCALMIQKNIRCWLCRKKYLKMKKSALVIQRFVRCAQARILVTKLRREKSAVKIQSYWRCCVQMKKYRATRGAVVTVQCHVRGFIARKHYRVLLRNHKAIVIQKYVRGWLARKSYKYQLKCIIIIQCCIRRYHAKKELKKLKIEARSVGHLKKLNIGMENKIMELQRKLDNSANENTRLSEVVSQNEQLKSELLRHKDADDIIMQLRKQVGELEEKVRMTEGKMSDQEKGFESRLQKEKDENVEINKKMETMTVEIEILKDQNKNQLIQSQADVEAVKKEMHEMQASEKEQLEEEISSLNQQVQDYKQQCDVSLQRYENLKDELHVVRTSQQINNSLKETVNGDIPHNEDNSELNERISQLEKENEELKGSSRNKKEQESNDQLSAENERLRNELASLRRAVSENSGGDPQSNIIKELTEQLETIQEELQMHKNDVVRLKNVEIDLKKKIGLQVEKQNKLTTSSTMTDSELLGGRNRMNDINVEKLDKNDLKTVLAKVFDHNRMLEAELEDLRKQQDQQVRHKAPTNVGGFDVAGDLDDYSKQMTRVNHENIKLKSQLSTYEQLTDKLKRQIKLYAKKLNEVPVEVTANTNIDDDVKYHPVLRHKDSSVSSLGMLQYKFGNEFHIVKRIVHEYQPSSENLASEIPGLHAFLLFKLLRYADHYNDERMIKSLLQQVISGIKTIEKKYDSDFNIMSFWLANCSRFLHCMKQYSGEDEFLDECSDQQQKHCLRNFDLSEYRPVFQDCVNSLYAKLLESIEKRIKPMIVPAMLESDTIQGDTSKPISRGRTASRNSNDFHLQNFTVEQLLKELSRLHATMIGHGIEKRVVCDVFRQILYFVTSHSLNNQLMRKELCNWSKAMQIRFNVTQIEDWLRNMYALNEQVKALRNELEPLVHASQLLQLKKQNEKDAKEICDMCTSLNSLQIVKLLQMVTPTNDYEEKVSMKFVRQVQSILNKKKNKGNVKLLNDTSLRFQTSLNKFHPSPVDLCSVNPSDKLVSSQLDQYVTSI